MQLLSLGIVIAISSRRKWASENAYIDLAALKTADGMTVDAINALTQGYNVAKLACTNLKTTLFGRNPLTHWRSKEGNDLDWYLDSLTSERHFGILRGVPEYDALVEKIKIESASMKFP